MWKNINRLNYIFIVFIFFIFLYSILYASVGLDAGYYLTISKWIAEGLIPYSEFKLAYTYNFFYLNILPFLFSKNPSYEYFLLLQIILICLNTFLLYKIISGFIFNKVFAVFLSIYYIMLNIAHGALEIGLETLTITFFLLSLYFFFKAVKNANSLNYFLCGFFAIEAFFTKQYAVLFIVALSVGTFIYGLILKRQYWRYLYLYSGLLVGIILNLLVIRYYFNSSIGEFIFQISGGGYGLRSRILMVNEIFEFLIRTGSIVGFTYLLYHFKSFFYFKEISESVKKFIFSLILLPTILILFLQFYFQSFDHYSQLIFPFLVVSVAVIISIQGKSISIRPLLTGMVVYMFYFLFLSVRYTLNWNKSNEIKLTEIVNNNTAGKKVFLFSNYELYFTSKIIPVDIKKYGIAFPGSIDSASLREVVNRSEILVMRENDFDKNVRQFRLKIKDSILYNGTVLIIKDN